MSECTKCYIQQRRYRLPYYIPRENIPIGPSSIKHLYSSQPGNYSQRFDERPQNALYGYDFSKRHSTGMGQNKILNGGHYIAYPSNNMNRSEESHYTDYHFPRPPLNTERHHKVITTDNHVKTGNWM